MPRVLPSHVVTVDSFTNNVVLNFVPLDHTASSPTRRFPSPRIAREGSLKNVIAIPDFPSEETASKYQYSHAVSLIADSFGTSNGSVGDVLMLTGP